MEYKTFIADNKLFKLDLPEDWDQYDDEDDDDNAYAFFNAKSPEWRGNLRITLFIGKPLSGKASSMVSDIIESQLYENDKAERIKIANFDCAHYKDQIEDDDEELSIWYWTFGVDNILFICSFTAPGYEQTPQQQMTGFDVAEKILHSIQILA
jgi:hypothetical protein